MATNIGKRVYDPLNKQITDEYIFAFLFLSMSSVLSDMGLNGCSEWTKMQFHNRMFRGTLIYEHILKRGAKIRLMQMPAFKQDWRAPLHIFEEILRMEQRTTNAIAGIADLAIADKDHATNCFLRFFINQQVEKEAEITFLLDRLRKMQSTELGVIMFDAELSKKHYQYNPMSSDGVTLGRGNT